MDPHHFPTQDPWPNLTSYTSYIVATTSLSIHSLVLCKILILQHHVAPVCPLLPLTSCQEGDDRPCKAKPHRTLVNHPKFLLAWPCGETIGRARVRKGDARSEFPRCGDSTTIGSMGQADPYPLMAAGPPAKGFSLRIVLHDGHGSADSLPSIRHTHTHRSIACSWRRL